MVSLWLGAMTSEALHPAVEAHIVCAVHGQIEDAPTYAGQGVSTRSILTKADVTRGEHHACPLVGAPGSATAWVGPTSTPVPPLPPLPSPPLLPAPAPRPPPLGYAPKTSPPSFS